MTGAGLSELLLVGYVPLTEHGFALPCFASGPQPNAWYTAVCSIDGDHDGLITAFELFESDEIRRLPPEMHRRAAIGDQWLDVFLWDGVTNVGTADAVWNAVAPFRSDISEKAPLTLLDLALSAEPEAAACLAKGAFDFMRLRYGVEKAETWRRDTLIREQAVLRLRRLAAAASLPQRTVKDLKSSVEVSQTSPATFSICLSATTRHAFARANQLDDVAAELAALGELLDTQIEPSHSQTEGAASAEVLAESAATAASWSGLHDINILILVSGRRAREIARHLSPPEWLPEWLEDAVPHEIRRMNHGAKLGKEKTDRPSIDIVDDLSVLESLAGYAVIVCLADDDLHEGAEHLFGFVERVGMEARGVTLLAPALPVQGPSQALAEAGEQPRIGSLKFHTVVDTSIARSPFWSGNPRRALDRRIADIVVGAAVLCVGLTPIVQHLTSRRAGHRDTLMTFAIQGGRHGKADHSPALFPMPSMASETTWASRADPGSYGRTLTKLEFAARMCDRAPSSHVRGVVEVRDRRPHFEDFARAVLENVADEQSLMSQPGQQNVPSAILGELAYPESSAGFALRRPDLAGALLTSETPSLNAVRTAGAHGWAVVRYTDRETIRDVLDGDRSVELPLLPREVLLPNVRRLKGNRGLATRGIDPRDVVRFGFDDFEEWRAVDGDAHLVTRARRYRSSIRTDTDALRRSDLDCVLPLREIRDAFEQGDIAATRLLNRLSRRDPLRSGAAKRLSDLQNAWSRPSGGARRFIIDDGVIPVSIGEIGPNEVPSQRFFFIDGDSSVPALLTSRVFAVWARATMSRSTSWMSRFSVSGTFETFPVPGLFHLQRPSDGPLQLLHGKFNSRFAKLLATFDRDDFVSGRVMEERGASGHERKPGTLLQAIDEALLAAIELPAVATDLDILERLLDMNRVAPD
ncbi:hypothetical protein [Chelativorans sp. M5D2P16]|uniref:hypothetical protein n=1 Tax=Chelativorans sp. M5D2P16 TaxID=3095678 RepID=UPI002ACAB2F9|nr:hypothetical protein [Chelativorans sp. M5D2P16]MDZ5698639.1 hypothetical protein [Chelativorans sp. M5D2P16]